MDKTIKCKSCGKQLGENDSWAYQGGDDFQCIKCGAASDTITITKKEYEKLKEKRDLLDALEAAGVDNWDGWDYAMEILGKEDK